MRKVDSTTVIVKKGISTEPNCIEYEVTLAASDALISYQTPGEIKLDTYHPEKKNSR